MHAHVVKMFQCNYPARVVVLFTERHTRRARIDERRPQIALAFSQRSFTVSPFTARDLR
jgi:hypothetical protein